MNDRLPRSLLHLDPVPTATDAHAHAHAPSRYLSPLHPFAFARPLHRKMDAGRQTISPTNKGPVLTTISWVFMVVMLLAVLTKIWNKWQRTRSLVLDDLLLALAAVRLSHPCQWYILTAPRPLLLARPLSSVLKPPRDWASPSTTSVHARYPSSPRYGAPWFACMWLLR